MKHKLITVLVAAALATIGATAQAAQGISSSQDSYLQGVASGVDFTSVLTTGDAVGGYRMAGIPDGLGAYDNGNGTFTVLMNHEIGDTLGVAHGPLTKGSFVSEWVINKTTLQVVSGGDLINKVYGWDSTNQSTGALMSSATFNRFCSADLASTSALSYTANGTTYGTTSRIFFNGEEGGVNGRALATVATGADKGSSYVLGKMNQATNGSTNTSVGGWENLLANPVSQLKTVVIGNNDGGTGMMNNSLAVYVGTKQTTGSEIEKAGLTNGTTKFINVAGVANELNNTAATSDRTTAIADGTRFTLSATASTTFSRPEDGTWSADGKTFYFVTTDQLDKTDLTGQTQKGGTRLWALSFDDIANPDAGGTIKKLIDTADTTKFGPGVVKPNMFDNMTINKDGTFTLLEDVGNAPHNGKIWNFDPVTGKLTMMGKFNPALFGDIVNGTAIAGSFTQDEETSGVIDITDILGRNDGKQYSLLVAQNHLASADPLLVEGGQLLVMAAVPEPETYAMMLAGLGMLGFAARRRNAK
jgi:hypothetical protein